MTRVKKPPAERAAQGGSFQTPSLLFAPSSQIRDLICKPGGPPIAPLTDRTIWSAYTIEEAPFGLYFEQAVARSTDERLKAAYRLLLARANQRPPEFDRGGYQANSWGWVDWASEEWLRANPHLGELITGIRWLSLSRDEQRKTPPPDFTPLDDGMKKALQAAVRAYEMGIDVSSILFQQLRTEHRLQTADDRKNHRLAELPAKAGWLGNPRPKVLPNAHLIVKLVKDDPEVRFSWRMVEYILAILETYPSKSAKALLKALRQRPPNAARRTLVWDALADVDSRMGLLRESEAVAVAAVAKQMSLTTAAVRKRITEARRKKGIRTHPFRERTKRRPSKN